MKENTAVECFNENLKRIDDPQSDPEKYYLYQGLLNLATTLHSLQNDMRTLKRNLAQVQTIVKRKSFSTGRWTR